MAKNYFFTNNKNYLSKVQLSLVNTSLIKIKSYIIKAIKQILKHPFI